jgi:hypothetical protein
MSTAVCTRCAEPFARPDSNPLCKFCAGELREKAVIALTEARGNSNRAKLQRVAAIDTLRTLGHSQPEVLRARARAFDGHSVGEILEGLCGDGVEGKAVAA